MVDLIGFISDNEIMERSPLQERIIKKEDNVIYVSFKRDLVFCPWCKVYFDRTNWPTKRWVCNPMYRTHFPKFDGGPDTPFQGA